VAKALALGANAVGIGLPLLRAALKDDQAPTELLAYFVRGLKIAMLASGCENIARLQYALRREDVAAPVKQRTNAEVDEHGF